MRKELTKVRSEFNSPTYKVEKIPVEDIIGQSVNPNSLTGKAFAALQTSIFNAGYSMPITCCANSLYDENTDTLSILDKLAMVIEGGQGDNKSGVGSADTFATQVSDENIRKMFKVQIVDGQQRSSVVRLGTKYFLEDDNREKKAESWGKGENLPEEPGRDMLEYIAWREDFCLPCVVQEGKSDVELMSMTVLMNTARGSHSLDSMKDIVATLINVAGMSEDWVARNLFLDLESVKRMTQLSGLKSAFDNLAETDLAWNPEEDGSYIRKQNSYLNREASKFIAEWVKNNPDKAKPEGNVQDVAVQLGWNKEEAINIKQTSVEVAPNGVRREGRIQNGVLS